ncbi:MAG: hypothetical protein HY303_11435 [Candidatus Wallbacteria bacterium]|nr:hypothetical protein [Candidatus Wallbacteria bacterium]
MKNVSLKVVFAAMLASMTVTNTGCSFMETLMQMFGGAAGNAVSKETGSSALGGAASSAIGSYASSQAKTATAAKPASASPSPAAAKPAGDTRTAASNTTGEVTRIKAGDEP